MASLLSSPGRDEDHPDTLPPLTPRSKVKAMLATLEDGDANDLTITHQSLGSPSRILSTQDAITLDNEVDGDTILPPRGRLAGRMQARDNSPIKIAQSTTPERPQKMLAQPGTHMPHNQGESSDDDDEDIPAVRRRPRKNESLTPSLRSSPQTVRSSPGGLFVSPYSNKSRSPRVGSDVGSNSSSDSDSLPAQPIRNARFMALVQKKREERLAKEAELKRQKAEREADRLRNASKHTTPLGSDDGLDLGSDDDAGRRLTQQSRPTRKASKKALEEMERETQRMSRNMQLAHQARTKKKITKASLLAKFNYKPAGVFEESSTTSEQITSSSPRRSEREDTPPSSPPPVHADEEKRQSESEAISSNLHKTVTLDDSSKPSLPLEPTVDKSKDKAVEGITTSRPAKGNLLFGPLPTIKSRTPKLREPIVNLSDSESDLEVISKTPIRAKIDSIFNNVPAKQAREHHSLQALRVLAHIGSPDKKRGKKSDKPSINAAELGINLQRRAREQAAHEREQRLNELRARGVVILTAEEREKEATEVENLLVKARQEGEEIMRRERDAAKKERKANGETNSEDDDEEWNESDEELSNSGSEDDEEEDQDDAVNAIQGTALFEVEASESENDVREEEENGIRAQVPVEVVDVSDTDGEDEVAIQRPRRRQKTKIAISDDEDDTVGLVPQSPVPRHHSSPSGLPTDSPQPPTSVLRSATKSFIPGLPVNGPVGLGLTQIFAGTMDESQQLDGPAPISTLPETPRARNGGDEISFLRRLPAPSLPAFQPTEDDSQFGDSVADSQTPTARVAQSQQPKNETQGISFDFSQSQIHEFDSLLRDPATQISDLPDATQDVGFQYNSPIGRFGPSSTVEIDLLGQDYQIADTESPVIKRKGKLRQRAQAMAISDDEAPSADNDDLEITTDVFDVMRKASKKKAPVEDFDKKKSKAKEMVYEQAEESEDEYAGLGGASDEESDGEADEYMKQIINDDGGEEVDERELAAFFADKERANDEKQVEKLFKDITNGMLRRKRGADYDLSDSDDDGEARRRRKRREFAKMRKALLADERLGKIAENPKKAAFMRAVEDIGDEDFISFLDDSAEADETGDSQSASQAEAVEETMRVPDSQPDIMTTGQKRKLETEVEPGKRLPPHLRRTKPSQKPSNLSDIRKSVSDLIEDHNSFYESVHESDSDGADGEINDDEDRSAYTNKENFDPFARRHRDLNIVDRISQKRTASSNTSSNSTRMAFGGTTNGGFKVPALLRRATTNSSVGSGSSTSTASTSISAASHMTSGSGSRAGIGADSTIRRPRGKNSGVNFFARENERHAKIAEAEKKRNEKRWSGAQDRRKAVSGLFGKGKFE